jgi:transposase
LKISNDEAASLFTSSAASTATATKQIEEKIQSLRIQAWTTLKIDTVKRIVTVEKNDEQLVTESQLDGVYILKTDVKTETACIATIHDRYKDLSKVESAFRTMKTGYLEVRPIFVRKDPRTRGHVFVVMLAYLLVQELESYWKDLELTTKEGIDELSSIVYTTVTVNEVTCLKLPEPTTRAANLLNHANLALPAVLPNKQGGVHTTAAA